MKKLTVKEAIEQGYTSWAYRSDEPFIRSLDHVTNESFRQAIEDETPMMLVEKTGYKYTVSADNIRELVIDMLVNQDEVADEDCELCDLAADADYEPLSIDINKRLSKRTFYDMSDIELIPRSLNPHQ